MIWSLIITYNPEHARLRLVLDSLLPQVDGVLIVDNASSNSIEHALQFYSNSVCIRKLSENVGIAKAQNIGIQWLRQQNAEYVLLMDHDSVPAPDMVVSLLSSYKRLLECDMPIAVVGPMYADRRFSDHSPFIRIENLKLRRLQCEPGHVFVEVSYLVASGNLIRISTFDVVGEMNEDLFIDYVDIEWCLRASSMGLKSYGVCNAYMDHYLGDQPIVIMSKKYPSRSPLRHYYMFRNAIYLYGLNQYPLNWKIVDGVKLILKYFFYCLLGRPSGWQHCKMMTVGIFHGFLRRMGRYN